MRAGELKPGEVMVWFAKATPATVSAARALLSAEELERAARVRVKRARDEFVVGRAMLRVLAGEATGVAVRAVEMSAGPMGKLAVHGVECNVAHSHGLVAVALAREVAVGVDVEAVDRAVEALDVARGTFAVSEVAEIERASVAERTSVFCRIWTKKEAVLKAHGQGLTFGLDKFSVSAARAGEMAVPLGDREFFVREMEAPEGFVGAIACGARGMLVRVVELDEVKLMGLLRGV